MAEGPAGTKTDTTALHARLGAAMDRIGAALAAADGGSEGQTPDAARSEAEARVAAAEQALEEARREAAERAQALEAETAANAQLRERVGNLKDRKESQAARIAELEAERDALARARAEDRAELDALIAALEPLAKEQRHA